MNIMVNITVPRNTDTWGGIREKEGDRDHWICGVEQSYIRRECMGKMDDCSGWLLDGARTIAKKCSDGNFDMLDDRACLHIFFLATVPV